MMENRSQRTIRAALVACALSAFASSQVSQGLGGAQENRFMPEVRKLGVGQTKMIDPEILNPEGLLTYQDEVGNIWLHELDAASGLFAIGRPGKVVAKGAFNLRGSYNGPEFGRDSQGWAIFFTGLDKDIPQIWRTELIGGEFDAGPLLTDGDRRQSILASKNPNSPTMRLLYLKGSLQGGDFHWLDESAPSKETATVALNEVDSPRWIDDTLTYVYAESTGPERGQLKLIDTTNGRVRTITNDAGVKAFAYGWKAPEYGGALLVLALVDYKEVGVWRDTGDAFWERIATLPPPAESKFRHFGSPEPFTAGGRSYISLVLKSENSRGGFRDSEVWIFGVEGGAKRFARRVDDGGSPLMRVDPETFTGSSEVFVYYNALTANRAFEIHRARTGLRP